MAILVANSVTLPEPSAYKVTAQDIDSENSGRNENGVMFRERVRHNVYKVEASWQNLNETKKNTIVNAVGGASTPSTFSVTFYYGSSYITKTMYVGDRKTDLVWNPQTGAIWNVSVNFIEV